MCPAISMPQQYGLVKSLSPGVTKLLLTVSKILQSCANSDMSTAGRALSSTDTYVRELGGDYNEILRHQIRLMCGIMVSSGTSFSTKCNQCTHHSVLGEWRQCEAGETQKKESGSGIRAAHSNKLPKEVSSFFSALPAYQGLQASLQSIGALKPTCLWNSEEVRGVYFTELNYICNKTSRFLTSWMFMASSRTPRKFEKAKLLEWIS